MQIGHFRMRKNDGSFGECGLVRTENSICAGNSNFLSENNPVCKKRRDMDLVWELHAPEGGITLYVYRLCWNLCLGKQTFHELKTTSAVNQQANQTKPSSPTSSTVSALFAFSMHSNRNWARYTWPRLSFLFNGYFTATLVRISYGVEWGNLEGWGEIIISRRKDRLIPSVFHHLREHRIHNYFKIRKYSTVNFSDNMTCNSL